MGSLGCTPRPLVVPLGLANISLDTIGPSRPPVCTALTNNQRTHQMLPLILGDSFDLPLDPLGPRRPTLWPPGSHWPIWSCFLVDLFISKTLDLQNPKESQQNPDSPNTLFRGMGVKTTFTAGTYKPVVVVTIIEGSHPAIVTRCPTPRSSTGWLFYWPTPKSSKCQIT